MATVTLVDLYEHDMGAGRRTSTYDIDTGAAQLGFVERQRNLGENLGGVIFGQSKHKR